jgi:hypothetical protein
LLVNGLRELIIKGSKGAESIITIMITALGDLILQFFLPSPKENVIVNPIVNLIEHRTLMTTPASKVASSEASLEAVWVLL